MVCEEEWKKLLVVGQQQSGDLKTKNQSLTTVQAFFALAA